jgi:hypothetical protein
VGRRRQLFHLASVDCFDQRIRCREMAIQGAGSDTRLLRDVVQTGSRAVARKSPFTTSRIRSRLRRASVRGFRGQASSSFPKNPATGDSLRLSINSESISGLAAETPARQCSEPIKHVNYTENQYEEDMVYHRRLSWLGASGPKPH